jgi:hypothetical protein
MTELVDFYTANLEVAAATELDVETMWKVFRLDAASVVGDTDERDPALLDADIHPGGARVDGVLEQLLHDARGPFHDLARGDAIDHGGGQLCDSSRAAQLS